MKFILHKPRNEKERLVSHKIKHIWLFEYFGQLNSGMVGYGVTYLSWLEIFKGWKLTKKNYMEFEKCPKIDYDGHINERKLKTNQ